MSRAVIGPTVTISCLKSIHEAPRLLPDVRPVRLGGEETLEVSRIRDPKPDHPTVTIRVAIDDGRVIVERIVYLDDLTGHWAVKLGDSLDRLDLAEGLMGIEPIAGLRESDEDHIAQLTLRIVSDADLDHRGLAVTCDILMFRSIEQLVRYVRHPRSPM
jgi:hypothetical protein